MVSIMFVLWVIKYFFIIILIVKLFYNVRIGIFFFVLRLKIVKFFSSLVYRKGLVRSSFLVWIIVLIINRVFEVD